MGGQTALNTALALEQNGILRTHHEEMIGANTDIIEKSEQHERLDIALISTSLETTR